MQMGQPDTVPGDAAAEAGKPEGEGEAGNVAEAAAAAMSRLLKRRKQRGPKLL
jgi:hypothetical protein